MIKECMAVVVWFCICLACTGLFFTELDRLAARPAQPFPDVSIAVTPSATPGPEASISGTPPGRLLRGEQ